MKKSSSPLTAAIHLNKCIISFSPDHDQWRSIRHIVHGLATWCIAEHDIRIVADDVYELLQWDVASAPKSLRWHAQQQQAESTVVSCMGSSFFTLS